MADTWDPAQYERFRSERAQPFHDLLALVRSVPGGRVVDLGCGTGDLTRLLHQRTGARQTLGMDLSPAMLERSAAFAGGGLRFEQGDLAELSGGPFDLIFSNAAIHWVGDHPRLIERWAGLLSPGGQLAIQLPANQGHPTHTVAHAVAQQEPFSAHLSGPPPGHAVLAPEAYAELLFEHGFSEQHVRLQVYAHVLPSRHEAIEWVKGTLLTDYRRRLPAELYESFLERYREALFERLADRRPFFFPFKRILLWGVRR